MSRTREAVLIVGLSAAAMILIRWLADLLRGVPN